MNRSNFDKLASSSASKSASKSCISSPAWGILRIRSFNPSSSSNSGIPFTIVEEIISQLTSASSAEGFGMVRTNDNAYGVYANYGVDDEEDFFISVNVVDYSKQGTAEYTILRTEVLDRWDDDSEQEHSEHQKYLKDIADDFLRLVDNIKVDGRLGKLLFLKSWKQILKRGDK